MEALKQQPQARLILIKGGVKSQYQRCVIATWQVAQSALWADKVFTDTDKEEFLSLISEYYRGSKNKPACFKQIVQRILLARRYVKGNKYRYIAKPADWLNIHFRYGISGTKTWYERIREERKKVPHYHEGIKLFADGAWEYLSSPTAEHYNRLHAQLFQREQHDLIVVLHHLVAIHQFGK
ncbi:MAG: hypothetical protein EWV91_07080 [Microcystis aeruginosa Ma_QC_Ca_00000000_S207]|uniref:Uncharacterized protein n=1 Tax=Microcystis aeruginosa Ma_QC_Ca_00000000_S207 TaxID=2486251 RepID=A0A552FT80_MICAE|nr:MAG: hypothetical protein EWV91_07080 [Microcystis aeruginosa Ma_QC_Ca_00000000_S207]